MNFQEVKRPLRTKSVKRPIKVGKRPIKEEKRPIKAMVLVGISVGCLMGCFRSPLPRRKTAPLKRPIKRSMTDPCFSGAKATFSSFPRIGFESLISKIRPTAFIWEVLNGVGVDGVGVIFPLFYAFFVFYANFRFFSLFFVFLRFSLLLLEDKGKQQQNLLQKRGISLRPRLHRPRPKLPDLLWPALGDWEDIWVLFCPTFLSVRNSSVFALYGPLKAN